MHIAAVAWFIILNGLSFCCSFFNALISPDKAAITFTTGLLAIMNREELEGVIGHEMSHIKNHDIRLLLVVGTMIGMAALLASIFWRSAFFAGGGRGGGRGNQLVIVIFAAGEEC